MTSKQEILLLQVISHNGNITNLTRHGFSYSQIFKQIKILEKNELIVFDKDKNVILITEKGVLHIKELNKVHGRINSSAWISPLYEKQVKKIGVDDVYLPRKIKT